MAADTQSEPQKRMACWNCPRYDRAERRCQDGKTNPRSKADSVAVAELLGVRALCHYNLYRDSIAVRMYFPRESIALLPARSKNARRPRAARIEIEIEAVE